ncbi:MAG: methylamine dehydrogenase accessory protein MauD [Haliea sp.]|nr:methylamine dehydrogenase accessory protein MauD [Haliea sp.]
MSALAVSHILLWVIVVILCFVVFALLRQIGVLHERVFPAGALMTNRGPQAGDPAPAMQLRAFDDSHIALADGIRSTLLLFVSPTCPVCKTLLPIVASVEKTERAQHPLQVILASDGDSAQEQGQHLEFIDTHRLDKSRYVVSKPLGLAFVVEKLPFAALIDRAGVIRAKGLVNSREHLESLFEAHERGVSSLQEYLAHD